MIILFFNRVPIGSEDSSKSLAWLT